MAKQIKPFGSWPSPLSARDVAGAALRFGLVRGGSDGTIYWSEGRPSEQGRCAIMRKRPAGDVEELLPPPFSARSGVHEYGGGEFTVAGDIVFFVNHADQDIYRLVPGRQPERITNAPNMRFADMLFDRQRNRLIAIGESHKDDKEDDNKDSQEDKEDHPQNYIVAIDLNSAPEAELSTLVSGQDFYAAPALEEDGAKLAWLRWNLPDMPWDSAALNVADISHDGSVGPAQEIAGGRGSAVFQPEWTSDGALTFVWDKTGWANLYRYSSGVIEQRTQMQAECSRPLWAFGMRSYAHLPDGTALAALQNGVVSLTDIRAEPWAAARGLKSIDCVVKAGDGIAALCTDDNIAPAIISLTKDNKTIIRKSASSVLQEADISCGQPLSFTNRDGETVYGHYYPPQNANFAGLQYDEKPPILFTVHGGPTGMGDRGLKLKTQFWTSRGFGVFDTDYSGSTGYGRAYQERLDGLWGVKDVSDIADAASFMVAEGKGDPKKLFVTGSSAGGMTVLLALADHDIFAGGVCTYGVTDLIHLLNFTHKFEAGYLYRLLGVEPGDETNPLWRARSPIAKAQKISAPVIFFQGLDDKVVPPGQSRNMVAALEKNGVPVDYVEFVGEGHGFRQASTIKTVLEREYAFYAALLKLGPVPSA